MAPASHGSASQHRQHAFANGNTNGGPPASTLAAQLVDNISRSARSDDTGELKRLFAVIERIQEKPDLLKTTQDRIEHGHMLIYVSALVALDGTKWDDPFANHHQLRAEALNALEFLQVTIKETPAVLKYRTDGRSFDARGEEPLWMWLLPNILRLLWHDKCLDISPAIEVLCQCILRATESVGVLWDLESEITSYLQRNFTAILSGMKRTKGDDAVKIHLPMSGTRYGVFFARNRSPLSSCSYEIHSVSQALRQALSLLTVIKTLCLQEGSRFADLFAQRQVWLLDSALSLFQVWSSRQKTANFPKTAFLELVLDVVVAHDGIDGFQDIANQKLNCTLVLICSGIANGPDELLGENEHAFTARNTLCSALIQVAKAAARCMSVSRLVKGQLLPVIKALTAEHNALGSGTDFCRSVLLLEQVSGTSSAEVHSQEVQPASFNDRKLQRDVAALGFTMGLDTPGQQVRKRRRLSLETETAVMERLQRMVPESSCADLIDLGHALVNAFPNLNSNDQCNVIELLSRLACASDGTLQITEATANGSREVCCPVCEPGAATSSQSPDTALKSLACSIFMSIIKIPSFVESKRPRVTAMILLRRLLHHSTDPELWNLERSGLGHWCLQSLQSSLRELRIAAGRALALFVAENTPISADHVIMERNRGNALAILKSISDKDVANLHESCILTWGQIGRVAPDEELNLVLIQLIEYLGHRNLIVSAFAFNEILSLSQHRGTNPRQLMAPFWKSLAYTTVKDLISKPQTTRMVAELLQIGVPELLRSLQSYALPWLVLTKKREVMQKFAEARGDSEIWVTCCDGGNLSAILAVLLIQDVPNVEEFAMSQFRSISPHFNKFTLVELLGSEPLLTALSLLMISANGDEERRTRVQEALSLMARLLLLANPQDKRGKKTHHVGRYFQQHALGLTSRLSEVINDSMLRHPPVQEQRECIMAMEEMIKACKTYVRIARPQISACLLSALAFDDLRSAALSCWTVLLTHMEDEDVEALIETSFFIIDHYWRSFDQPSKERSTWLVSALLDNFPDVVRESISKLPSLSHIEEFAELNKRLESMKPPVDHRTAFTLFARRLSHENSGVVAQALNDLASYLRENQAYLQASALSEQPDTVVATLMRALLDCSAKYNSVQSDIARFCVECIGLVGCLDSNRLESIREQPEFVVTENFDGAEETTDFVAFMLDTVLVKSFLSATDTKFLGYLSYAMQELLARCDFTMACAQQGGRDTADVYRKWLKLQESTREVLTPFLTSRFALAPMPHQPIEYPIFRPGKGYVNWLRAFVVDLLRNSQNTFSQIIFEPLCRVIRVKDVSIAEFLLPYLVVHVVVGQEESSDLKTKVIGELLAILIYEPQEDATYVAREDMKLCYEAVFRILDYSYRWLQTTRARHGSTASSEKKFTNLQEVIFSLDPELLSRRAVDCKQYARALFYLELHVWKRSNAEDRDPNELSRLWGSLQDLYVEIDDPDGLEGVLARLPVVNLDEQILSHRKAGRWAATQTWYEIRLAEYPDNVEVQLDLLTCLKESGQHDVLLNYVEGMKTTNTASRIAPFAVEASWATGRWETLQKYLSLYNAERVSDVFNIGIAQALLCLKDGQLDAFNQHVQSLRDKTASSLTYSATASLQASHDARLKCHVLGDLYMIANHQEKDNHEALLTTLERRLEVLGAYVNNKQYVLGIRRAAMELMRPKFADGDISSLWLSGARLARKSGSMHQSFNAVLHALQLGDGSATIENARLLWKDGHQRKAIQALKGAIENNRFDLRTAGNAVPASSKNAGNQQSLLAARAHLLLAKWQDSAGQTQASALRQQYKLAASTHTHWEKGHYYLGRHYKKLLESEKALSPDDQSDEYISGETAKLVIENYLRSLSFGTKYLYQTLPRVLTLWLELGAQLNSAPEGKVSLTRELYQRRKIILSELHSCFSRHLSPKRLPAYIFYTALPQVVARIAHPNPQVFSVLQEIIVKVVEAHPRQALWSLFACMTTKQPSERRTRGLQILQKLRGSSKKVEGSSFDLRQLLRMGEKLAEQLLLACNNGDFQSNRTTMASITRDLNFNHKCTPCPLVVPIETCLTATLPTLTDNVVKHKAFSRDVVTIDTFLDEVLVLGSLAKPRKLTARGSDGKNYGLLIKPKDDLRTDQRLMEFNSMINRSLKRDAESSRRQLYIRTYAVTPLNEECGIIEWVDGLKTLRDILLAIYKTRGIAPNYGVIAQLMKDASTSDKNLYLFTETVLDMFPSVLPDWFFSRFATPSAWFAARLRYTRSCAVMSMVGTILGLGDRHGENVLLEEGNGGIFHVDFNCLFDKGLTFAQPERVPFRLTHNMSSAMGIYGTEGPFRLCSELTLRVLRQQEETLMTILEAFIYDPTLDLQRDKKHKSTVVRLNPTSVVESINRKVKGLLPDESIPLGVEGQVEVLIKQAVDPKNLTAMYIGWCPFL